MSDRAAIRHTQAVVTFGDRDTALWRCECGQPWPCDTAQVLDALDALVEALTEIADRYVTDHTIRPGAFAVWAGDKAVAALAQHRERTP